MNGPSSDLELVRRVRKKLENLEQTCMERYQAREQRVVTTLNFCINALEQMKNWAVFAIFPQDEQQSDKYVGFVEQRYQCIIGPLRMFVNAIERDIKQSAGISLKNRQNHPSTTPTRDARDNTQDQQNNTNLHQPQHTAHPPNHAHPSHSQPHHPNVRRGHSEATGPSDPLAGIAREPDTLVQSMLSSRDTGSGTPPQEAVRGLRGSQSARIRRNRSQESSPRSPLLSENASLKVKINQMSQEYLEEGASIKEAVMERLHKCRKDTRTLYRWGQASLLDLHDIVDESLADELYFMVRGKMARILSTISIFEEAAEQIEKNLSSHFPNGPHNATNTNNAEGSNGNQSMHGAQGHLNEPPERDTSSRMVGTTATVGRHDLLLDLPDLDDDDDDDDELDLRIDIPETDSPDDSTDRGLDEMMLSWSFGGGTIGTVHLPPDSSEASGGRLSQESTPRSGSTPEPPVSPRPRALVNHPKIMKLQNMALPSRFNGVSNNRCSATW